MNTPRYIDQLKDIIQQFDRAGRNRYFLFGSSVRKDRFRDIDLGVLGNHRTRQRLSDLRERLYHSGIPYTVDVVDFDQADREFSQYVLRHEPLVWIS
jgi:predicted nucleotidyltransferase